MKICSIIFFIFLIFPQIGTAQNEYKKRKISEVETKILYGYYEQDGNNAAVTGGIGSEELNHNATAVIITISLDSTQKISLEAGLDVYTSASTDKIDFVVSSASRKDFRFHTGLGYQKENPVKKIQRDYGAYFSIESDYLSLGLSYGLLKLSQDENTQFSLNGSVFFDDAGWYQDFLQRKGVIYPVELRDRDWVGSTRRNTFTLSVSLSQNLTPKANISLFSDVVLQQGLLATTFHRVYFIGQDEPKVETLPKQRWKLPLGVRFNYFIGNWAILRTYYRYYWDTFGIQAHTASVEVPFKIGAFFSLYPFYRYYYQTSADYFAPFQAHSLEETYFTSDYDLSGFNSHKIGLGIRFYPVRGIFRYKNPLLGKRKLRGLDFRYAYYDRSTGLFAHNFSIAITFEDN